jgi:hypothetical protein
MKIQPVHILDACAVIRDVSYMATFFDDLDQDEYAFTRLSQYIGRREPKPWLYHDVKFNVISVCHKQPSPPVDRASRRLCGLSSEGLVDIYSNSTDRSDVEDIPDAGIRTGLYGAVTHIREIGASLFVCGQRGQVYRRFGDNDWRHVDDGLLLPPVTDTSNLNAFLDNLLDGPNLNCIDGFNEHDLYVVGDSGGAWHYDGHAWHKLTLPTDEHLQWVRCYGTDEVWMCGYNGTLLKGNARQGFIDVSAVENNTTYWCLAKHQDKVYLSTMQGLEVYDGQVIRPVRTGLKPELQDGWRVDVAEGVLWTFGPKDIAWFDGNKWTRVHHVDNAKIGG